MARPEELTLDDLRKRARRHLNIRDTDTGQWSDARLTQEANAAQIWLGQKLLDFHRYWDPVTSDDLTPSAQNRIAAPEDFFWEKRLYKVENGQKIEECRIVRSEEEEGWQNLTAEDRETWFFLNKGFEYRGTQTVTSNTYVLEYIPALANLSEPGDVSVLPAQYHFVIALKMACVMARDTSELEKYAALKAELDDWMGIVENERQALQDLRLRERQPKVHKIGTLAWIREEVRRALAQTSKTIDYWTNMRVDPEINKAVIWLQLELMKLDEGFFIARKTRLTPTNNVIKLPGDMLRFRALLRMVGTTPVPQHVAVVPLTDAYRNTITSGPVYQSENAYPALYETWSIEDDNLIANSSKDLTGVYDLVYNYRLPELMSDEEKTPLPIEHLDLLVNRAVGNLALMAKELDVAAAQYQKAETQLVEVNERIAEQRVFNKMRQVSDVIGLEEDPMTGWGSGGWVGWQ